MKRMPKHEIPVVPTANLVDIAILLIIFYMACSNFVTQQSAKIRLPQAPSIDKVEEPLVLVMIDSQGVITLQGRPMSGPSDVASVVAELLKDKTSEESRRVMFRCDAGVSRSVFEPVLNAIVGAGGVIVAVGEKTGGA